MIRSWNRHQAGELRRIDRVDGDAESLRGTTYQGRVAGRFDRGDEEQPAGVGRQRCEPALERVFDPMGELLCVGQAEATGEFGVAEVLG